MDSPNIFTHKNSSQKGLTLIEVLIALGIASVLFGVGLVMTLSDYRATNARHEIQTIVTLLQTARSAAINNIDGSAHGVVIHPPEHPSSYVVFAGSSYAERTSADVIDQSYAVDVGEGSMGEVVFAARSGAVASSGAIVLVDSARNASTTISINAEGRISW